MGGSNWASGRWRVPMGKEEEFIERWTAWLSSTSKNVPGFRWARLLRSDDDLSVFISMSEWADTESLQAWQAAPGFEDGFAAARGLTGEFTGGNCHLASAVDPD